MSPDFILSFGMTKTLFIAPGFEIAPGECELTYARSSGPGGQNVNKVNTKAVLRWNLLASPTVPDHLRARLLEKLGPKLTRDGDLLVASDRFRDQPQNREDCFDKFRQILVDGIAQPKIRRPSKPTRGSVRRNEKAKSIQSDKKQSRRVPKGDY